MKSLIQQEDTTILTVQASNSVVPDYTQQQLTQLKGDTSPPPWLQVGPSREDKTTDPEDAGTTCHTHTPHPAAAKQILVESHGTFPRRRHVAAVVTVTTQDWVTAAGPSSPAFRPTGPPPA